MIMIEFIILMLKFVIGFGIFRVVVTLLLPDPDNWYKGEK